MSTKAQFFSRHTRDEISLAQELVIAHLNRDFILIKTLGELRDFASDTDWEKSLLFRSKQIKQNRAHV